MDQGTTTQRQPHRKRHMKRDFVDRQGMEEVLTKVGSEATSVVTPAVSEALFCKSFLYTSACEAISE